MPQLLVDNRHPRDAHAAHSPSSPDRQYELIVSPPLEAGPRLLATAADREAPGSQGRAVENPLPGPIDKRRRRRSLVLCVVGVSALAALLLVGAVVGASVVSSTWDDGVTMATAGNDVGALQRVIGRTLAPAVRAQIDRVVAPGAGRLGAYVSAASLAMALGGTSAAAGRSADAVRDAPSKLLRAAECVAYLGGGVASEATRLSNAALAAILESDENAWSLLRLSDMVAAQNFTVVPARFQSSWNASCASVMQQQFNGSVNNVPVVTQVQSQARASSSGPSGSRAQARAVDQGLCDKVVVDVFYVNGIFTTIDGFAKDVAHLESSIGELAASSPTLAHRTPRVTGVYNPTHAFVDLYEAAQQWSTANGVPVPRIGQLLAVVLGVARRSVLAGSLLSALNNIASTAAAHNVQSFNVELSEKIGDSLLHGRAVLVVSHSQGNFYANAAVESRSRTSVRIVAVATPAPYVGNVGVFAPYVTRTDDFVIGAVPGALRGNVDPTTDNDWLNHGFGAAYLGDPEARRAILEHVRSSLVALTPPTSVAASGIITVTLTWGAQPDIDLHIYEPGGRHVFYGAQIGQSGRIDVDDVSGFGPENYVVPCGTLQAGVYLIGINFYAGWGPDTATVLVTAGSLSQRYQYRVTTARGSAGDATPIILASISVSIPDPCCPVFRVDGAA